eukprot:171906-Pyramimonas_sp.AAC.1
MGTRGNETGTRGNEIGGVHLTMGTRGNEMAPLSDGLLRCAGGRGAGARRGGAAAASVWGGHVGAAPGSLPALPLPPLPPLLEVRAAFGHVGAPP